MCVCQMLCDVARVLELRLILRQPSPLWLSFTVEELQVYQQGAKVRARSAAASRSLGGWQSWVGGRDDRTPREAFMEVSQEGEGEGC